MATDRPRFSVSLDNETFERVNRFQIEGSFTTRSKAVEALILSALQKIEKSAHYQSKPEDPLSYLSKDEQTLVGNYRKLSSTGRKFIQQSMAMAVQSYGEKNGAVPDVDTAL